MLSYDWMVLRRRWHVVVVGLLLTAGLVYGASLLVGPKYLVTSNTLLLPPKTLNPQGKLVNPYLNLGGLEGIGDVVVKGLTSRTALDAAAEANVTGEYVMYRDPAVAAPVIYLSVQDSTAEGALQTQVYLLKVIPQTLERVQETTADVRRDTFVSSTVVTEDSTPEVMRRTQLRAMIMALVAGLGGTYVATGVIDGALRGRRRYPDDSNLPTVSAAPSDVPLPGPHADVAPLTEMFPIPKSPQAGVPPRATGVQLKPSSPNPSATATDGSASPPTSPFGLAPNRLHPNRPDGPRQGVDED